MTEAFANQKRWRQQNPLKRSIITAFAKARKRAEKLGIPFDVPKGTTLSLYDQSGGVCAVSGLPFKVTTTGVCTPFSPSLDRVKPELGYVVGNIRLVLHGVNSLKGDTDDDSDLVDICKAVVGRHKPESVPEAPSVDDYATGNKFSISGSLARVEGILEHVEHNGNNAATLCKADIENILYLAKKGK